MNNSLKVVIPMAGLGTRLRPQTWSKPKQLVGVAGKTVLDHVLDTLSTVPNPEKLELINIVGYLGDQIKEHIQDHYPHIKSQYVIQDDPRGQSHAIHLARECLSGEMMVVFADTLIETDLSFLVEETADMVAWVKPVPDPRRFGVAEVGANGLVKRLIEKPQDKRNNLAVVGFYYFKSAEDLLSAIEEQMRKDVQLKGEYYLVDAINILLERGKKMHTKKVDVWLDAGTPSALLETNRYLLENGNDNVSKISDRERMVVIPPVYIHPSAAIKDSIIGPFASIGADCHINRSIIRDTIIEEGARVTDAVLEDSLIGRQAKIQQRAGSINVGDQSVVSL